MTSATFCPNGHPAAAGDRFCATCGAPVPAAPASAPPPPPPPAQSGQAAAPARRSLWPIAIGALAVAAAAVVAVVALTGDGDTTGTVAGSTPGTSPPVTVAPTTPATVAPTTPPETVPPTVAGPAADTWTILVYLVGDNDLEGAAMIDLEEMAAVTPQDRFDIVVLADRAGGEYTGPAAGLADWTDAKLLQVEGEQVTVLEEYGEVDMSDPATLTRFVTDGLTGFPAAHYALILWDHGAALSGIGPDTDPGGDWPVLFPGDMTPAIRAALDAAGVSRLDIVGFDACLMASLEVAVEMAPVARYMIASEEYEPGAGWDWTALEYLATEPEPTAVGLGAEIVRAYHEYPAIAANPDHTLSMVDLDLIDELDAALAALAEQVTADMGTYAPLLGRQRGKVVEFGKKADPWQSFHLVDLGHLARRLAAVRSTDLSGTAGAVVEALRAAVVANRTGENARLALGLAVLFPSVPEIWDAMEPYYDEFAATSWRTVLDAYYTAGRAIPPDRMPSFGPGAAVTAEFVEPAGLQVSADVTGSLPGDVADVHLLLGRPAADGGVVFTSDVQGEPGEGATVSATHGLEAVYLDDRGLSGFEAVEGGAVLVFHRIRTTETATGSTVTVEVPLAYYPAGTGQWLDAMLVEQYTYDAAADEWSYGRDLLVTNEAGTLGSVRPRATGTLAPLYLFESAAGERTWGPDPAMPALSADLDALGLTIWTWGFPGTELVADLTVTDFGGNTASISTTVVVPDDWQTAVG